MTARNWLIWLFTGVVCIILGAAGHGQSANAVQTAPVPLNFQGRLADASGSPVQDGLYNIRFRAYLNDPTGGVATWTETHDGVNRVQVTNGIFNTQIGAISPFSASSFTVSTFYIEIELPTVATAQCDGLPGGLPSCLPSWTEGPMAPRQPIASTAYAMNTDLIDGIDGADLAQLASNNTVTGATIFRPASDSTTAFQIQKSDNTPLLVADTTNLAIKIGGGDVSSNASPALLVLDYKNTSGDPTGVNGASYYNSNTGSFRCYEASAWKDCIYKDPFMRESYTYRQDFMPGISLTPPIFTPSNSTSVDSTLSAYTNNDNSFISNPGSEVGRLGIWRFNTGTTTNGNAFISSPLLGSSLTYPYRFGEGVWSFSTSARMTNVSAVGNLYNAYFGLTGASIAPASGCTIRYSIADYSGDWTGVCGNGSTETKCPITDTPGTPGTRAVVAGTWYRLEFTVNSAGTLVTFSATNGANTYTCTVSATIPTATNLSLTTGILKSTGTTARTMDVDYLDFTYNTSNR